MAQAEIVVESMQVECDGLVKALETWRQCPNLEPDEVQEVDAWIQETQWSFAAGAKVTIEPKAQQAMAVDCHRATASVKAATERCSNGHRPKV